MLSLIVAAALVPISYSLPQDQPLTYEVGVTFDGFIPLFGGQQGKVMVSMVVAAKGETPTAEGTPRAVCELQDCQLLFNDAPIPIGIDAVKEYFPKTTVTMTPQGKVLKTDAPSKDVPIRLPGLDMQRFPDITYLTVEFPETGVEEGAEWFFKKAFGGSDMTFKMKATKITDAAVEMDVAIDQTADYMEDEAKQVVPEERDAAAKVHVVVKGTGKAVFNRARGVMESTTITGSADSTVTPIAGGESTKRNLALKVESKLRK